ncbi:MAG: hypothetical protein V1806_11495 [Pseudomonadota bacterium]
MEIMNDHRLEMLLMLPDALLGRMPTEVVGGQAPPLEVRRRGQELSIILGEQVGAEDILESLGGLLSGEHGLEHLHLEVRQPRGLDHLGLSALVVVLREHGPCFASITISGLPLWAQERLRLTGADNLLGHHWQGNFGPGFIHLHCGQAAPGGAQNQASR